MYGIAPAEREGPIEQPNTYYSIAAIQWNLFIMDTLGPAISGSFLLLYIGFPLPEVKCISMVPLGLQNLSLSERFFVLCP